MATDSYVIKRIEMLQEELEMLKKTVQDKGTRKPVKLRGIWKGAGFTESDIEDVRRSWSKE